MATERTYPREDSEYPEIMSKMDPLIIRVSPTVLVVGSISYTAKIKMGIKFTGFHIYVSSVGIPIYKEKVDVSAYNRGSSTTGEDSNAWNHIEELACEWMDNLEKSMIQDSTEKNIVDLLREIKFQMHYDLSGHSDQAHTYPNVELCDEQTTYMQDILKQLIDLNAHIFGGKDSNGNEIDDSLCERITAIENSIGTDEDGVSLRKQLSNIRGSIGENDAQGLWKDIKIIHEVIGNIDGEESKGLRKDMTEIKNALNADKGSVTEAITNGYEAVAGAVAVQTGKIVTLTNDVETLISNVGTVKLASGQYNKNYNTLCGRLNELILDYIGRADGGKLWSDIKGIQGNLSSMSSTLGTTSTNVNSILDKPILGMDSTHVTYLEWWGQDLYADGYYKMFDALKSTVDKVSFMRNAYYYYYNDWANTYVRVEK